MLYLAVLRTEKRTVITSRKHAAGHRYWPMQCDGRRLQNGYHWPQEKRKKHFTRKSPFNTRACRLGLVLLRSRMAPMRIVICWVEMAAGEGFLNSQLSPKPHGMNGILRWPGCGKEEAIKQ